MEKEEKTPEEYRKRLLQLAEYFSEHVVVPIDVKELCDILLFHNPYPEKFSTSLGINEPKIEVKSFYTPEELKSNKYSEIGHYDVAKKTATINSNFIDFYGDEQDFVYILLSLWHERCHHFEYMSYPDNLTPQLKDDENTYKIREVGNSICYETNLTAFVCKALNIEMPDDKKALEKANYKFYYQLINEENARRSSFILTKETLNNLLNDDFCKPKHKKFLSQCLKTLEKIYQIEIDYIKDKEYSVMRGAFEDAYDAAKKYSIKHIADIKEPIVKRQFANLKLCSLRQANISKGEYYNAILNMWIDPSELSIQSKDYIKDCNEYKLFMNYLLYEDIKREDAPMVFIPYNIKSRENLEKHITSNDICGVVFAWTIQGKVGLVKSLLDWTKQRKNRIINQVYTELVSNKQIKQKVHEQYERLTRVSNKALEKKITEDERDCLFNARDIIDLERTYTFVNLPESDKPERARKYLNDKLDAAACLIQLDRLEQKEGEHE